MNLAQIKIMAHELLEQRHIENDYIEYKKSDSFKGKILKTVCAFANNYMNREIGLLYIGIEELDNKETGVKAVPVRPISGINMDLIDEKCYIILAV